MTSSVTYLGMLGAACSSLVWFAGCSAETGDDAPGVSGASSAGASNGGAGGTITAAGAPAAGSTTLAGMAGSTFAGTVNRPSAGSGPSQSGSAGSPAAAGSGMTSTGGLAGAPASGGTPGAAGKASGGGPSAGTGGGTSTPPGPLDCGPKGAVIENAGNPKNRVNYVIVGDGYIAEQLETTYLQHINVAMAKRFSPVIGQPYTRYRKFVNICAIKLASPNGPIGSGATALDCTGDDQSRLARCSSSKADMAISSNLPPSFEVDWKAVVLNNNRWWNTGSVLMLWSGGHADADGAALHEGGHGFHQLADEYDGTGSGCTNESREVNSTADKAGTANKWTPWIGYNQTPGTGMQGVLEGSRYCNVGQFRPSDNSMMNLLFGDDEDTAFNAVSREKMIFDIWRAVTPVDSTDPPAGAVANPTTLTVNVVDPAVISVDWSVDGQVVAPNGGITFNVAGRGLSPGMHTIAAKAYDNAGDDLVRQKTGTEFGRQNWARSQQTVTWMVSVP